MTTRPFTTRSRHSGFSLMEVLIALGIFGVGLVAVAAVFPTAIAIQSETVRDLAGQRVAANARSLVEGMARSIDNTETNSSSWGNAFRTLTYQHNPLSATPPRGGTLAPFTLTPTAPGTSGKPGGVRPMIDQPLFDLSRQVTNPTWTAPVANPALDAVRSFHFLFNDEVRSYPKSIPNPRERNYYWYPLIQAKDLTSPNPTWVMYLMIMQRRGTDAIPQVRAVGVTGVNGKQITFRLGNGTLELDNDANDNGLPDVIQPGDFVLGDDGSIMRVVIATRNTITTDAIVSPTGIDQVYYAVALEGGVAFPNFVVKREGRSPIVRIEQFDLVVNDPDETSP